MTSMMMATAVSLNREGISKAETLTPTTKTISIMTRVTTTTVAMRATMMNRKPAAVSN